LKKGQVINVIYQYGRDYIRSLTTFNYETTPFYNRYEIILDGEYQNISDGGRLKSNTARGIVVKSYFNGLNTVLLVDSYNQQFIVDENIAYKNPIDSFYDFTINSSDIISISSFEENEDRQDILRKSTIGWLNGTQKHPSTDFIEIGDSIKIDGESEFRTILTTPYDAIKTDYRNTDNLSYFAKIGTSNYDGVSRGEGLDIVAEIENGKVVSLLWNKIEWDEYVTQRILPSPPGYGYETAPQLVFVAQPQKDEGGSIVAEAQGGGAKAYAVVNNGEIIDIVLYDQGSGYIAPPRVYVTRNYQVLRKGRNIETSLVVLDMSPNVIDARTLYITSGDIVGRPQPPILTISSFILLTPLEASRDITAIIQKQVDVAASNQRILQHTSTIDLSISIASISARTDIYTSSIETPLSNVVIGSQNNVSFSNTLTELQSGIRTFLKVNYLLAYKSIHATGAYLDASMDLDDTIAYVFGIEEIIQIELDPIDVFTDIEIVDIIQSTKVCDSVLSVNISQTSFIDIGLDISIIESKITKQITLIQSTGLSNIQVNTITQISPSVERFYKTGFIDYYIESILFTDPIIQRNLNAVVLNNPKNEVTRRSGSIIAVNNAVSNDENLTSYSVGTVGNNLGMLNDWYSNDNGYTNVSGLTFNEIEINYNQFTIKDFEEPNLSSISSSRSVWNLAYPSIQNPVTISSTNGNINSTVTAQKTTNFAASGYFYHSDGSNYGIVQYTGKTLTSFTGCSVYSGSTTITNTSQIIPYSI